ncbi:hypothetical protein ACIBO2_48875 [Nonomuraea sp. NPDC050022]|uniref:hypothetical protein n=1 Tax=unclassified Nonomuraea TaxID=2593643 RepID=UPI00340B2FF6
MLRNQPRRDLRWLSRDLHWLKRQGRKDRRITLSVLAGVLAAWIRQLSPTDPMPGSGPLLAISLGLVTASGAAWLVAAGFLAITARPRREPAEALRWVSHIARAKEWAFCSLSAYVAWHLLQFVTALLVR